MRWVGLYSMLQLSLKVSLTKVISESNESTAPSFQQRLDKADAQIFTLLTYKVCFKFNYRLSVYPKVKIL